MGIKELKEELRAILEHGAAVSDAKKRHDAEYASSVADRHSSKAKNAHERYSKSNDPSMKDDVLALHTSAARQHKVAADAHAGLGDNKTAAGHMKMYNFHNSKAAEVR